jgi:hypothetical protein
MANASGWEILCPDDFTAHWNGANHKEAISIDGDGRSATSHFGNGILTFHVGYLFRTSPGWAIWMRGRPNSHKEGIYPLEGVVETDWLDFPATMNWQFTQPGSVSFSRGETFCFLTLLPHSQMDDIQPTMPPISANKELNAAYAARSHSRSQFNQGLQKADPDVVAQGWQKNYTKGQNAYGAKAGSYHLTKRLLKSPQRIE